MGARHRHGVPELCAVPAHDGVREHRLPAAHAQDSGGRHPPRGGRRARHGPARAYRAAPATRPFRRPAAAHRAGARLRVQAAYHPDGRAFGRARQEAARPAPARDQEHPPVAPDHDPLRHPRPGRGADHVGPHLPDEQRPHRAARHAVGALFQAEDGVCGRLPRRFQLHRRRRAQGRGRTCRDRGRGRQGRRAARRRRRPAGGIARPHDGAPRAPVARERGAGRLERAARHRAAVDLRRRLHPPFRDRAGRARPGGAGADGGAGKRARRRPAADGGLAARKRGRPRRRQEDAS